jgi:hypothetical protein
MQATFPILKELYSYNLALLLLGLVFQIIVFFFTAIAILVV